MTETPAPWIVQFQKENGSMAAVIRCEIEFLEISLHIHKWREFYRPYKGIRFACGNLEYNSPTGQYCRLYDANLNKKARKSGKQVYILSPTRRHFWIYGRRRITVGSIPTQFIFPVLFPWYLSVWMFLK